MTALSASPGDTEISSLDEKFAQFLDARRAAVEKLQATQGWEGREEFLALYEVYRDAIEAKVLAAMRANNPASPSALPAPEVQAVLDVCYPHRATDVAHGWLFPGYYRMPPDTHPVL